MTLNRVLIIATVFVMITLNLHAMGDLLKNITINYDRRLRPNATGAADVVLIQIGIVSLGPLDAKSFTFEVDVYLRHWWNDARLRHTGGSSYNYNGNPSDVIWVPDTYFENSKKIQLHKVMTENSRAVIKPNGDVFVSMRVTAKSSCPMNLRLYPFDTQECQLVLGSYSFTGSELDLNWAPIPITFDTVDGQVQVSSFDYKGVETKKVIVTMGSQAEKFIVLKCIFKLQRSFKSIISRIYVPSSFLVVLTWATFYIPSTSIPARITLIVTNFLATVFITQSTSSNIADVEYTTAVGLYLLANVVFITLTLLILLLVLNLPDKDIKLFKITWRKGEKGSANEVGDTEMEQLRMPNEKQSGKTEMRSHYIDNYAKIIIPVSYVLFIMIYIVYFGVASSQD